MEIHSPSAEQLAALPRAVAIVGPTAVGKTALSLHLAERFDAEIVNLDSVQIYRGFDIGSAKASVSERARVRHHLLSELDADQGHNVGEYRRRALEAIEGIRARAKRALLVGGTGLYLRVVIHGLLKAPPPDAAIRQRHRQAADAPGGLEALHAELLEVDPELAQRLHPNDLVRVSRGLEVYEQTGTPLSALQRAHRFELPSLNALKIALWRPRPELYRRIEQRVDAMMRAGFQHECAALLERFDRTAQPFSSLGYRQMVSHLLDGEPLDQAVEAIKQRTRRYAKQQLNWLRSEPDTLWVRAPVFDDSGRLPSAMSEDLEAFFDRGQRPEAPLWATTRDEL